MNVWWSFPKYHDHLGGHRDRFGGYRHCFGGYRHRFSTYRDGKGCYRDRNWHTAIIFAHMEKFLGTMKGLAFHKDLCPSLGASHGTGQLAGWWLIMRLVFEYLNQTDIWFTNIRNHCHINKIYVLTSLFKEIFLTPTLCNWIYYGCHSSCHHRKFTPRHPWTAMSLSWILS